MLKLLPILIPADIPKSQIKLLPDFEAMACEVAYNFRRSDTAPTPAPDLTIHSFVTDDLREDLHFGSHAKLMEAAHERPSMRNSPHLSSQDSKFIFDEGRRATWQATEQADLFVRFATGSLLFDGYRFSSMDMPGPVHIVIGKGYGFYLMGERDDRDPSRRFGSVSSLKEHYPKLGEQMSQTGIEADLFVGITLWGEKNPSAHRRLQIAKDIRNLLPKVCVDPQGYEVLTPIWPKTIPSRVSYEASAINCRVRSKPKSKGEVNKGEIVW